MTTNHDQAFEHFFVHFTLGPEYRLRSDNLHTGLISESSGDVLRTWREQQDSLDGEGGRDARRANQEDDGALAAPLAIGLRLTWILAEALQQIPAAEWMPPIADARIRRAVEAIHANRKRPPTTMALAEGAGLHEKSFARLFRKHVGIPPHRYGLGLRLDGAATAILHGAEATERIAAEWGFSDRYHLTRLLKRHRGVTPGALRRQISP